MRDVLQENRLAGSRRRDDQTALTFAERSDQIDHAGRKVLRRRIVRLHLQPLVRIKRCQIVEMDLVADFLRVFEVDRIDLQQREIAFAFLRTADRPFDRIAGLQRKPPDLRRRNVDIVRAWQIVRVGGPQKTKAILQHLHHAFADDLHFLRRKLLQDRKHQLLLAHDTGVFDLERFGEGDEIGRLLALELLKFHFLHGADSEFRRENVGDTRCAPDAAEEEERKGRVCRGGSCLLSPPLPKSKAAFVMAA